MTQENVFYATGKRKSSVARTWLKPGNGVFTINNRAVNDYFTVESARVRALQALALTSTKEAVDVKVMVAGGGSTGQAGAIRHGITRALMEWQPELRAALKKAGFVTRDPRIKERKKYGQKGARARFQFSKR